MNTDNLIEFCKEHLEYNTTSEEEIMLDYAEGEGNIRTPKAYVQKKLRPNLWALHPDEKFMGDLYRFCLWYYANYVSRPVIDSCSYQTFMQDPPESTPELTNENNIHTH